MASSLWFPCVNPVKFSPFDWKHIVIDDDDGVPYGMYVVGLVGPLRHAPAVCGSQYCHDLLLKFVRPVARWMLRETRFARSGHHTRTKRPRGGWGHHVAGHRWTKAEAGKPFHSRVVGGKLSGLMTELSNNLEEVNWSQSLRV